MKALVKARAEPGLSPDDVPEPPIGITDVLIRVLRTGICGTDVHIFDWNDWAKKTISVPMVIGHEFMGEIVEVSSNVNDFHPGEWVSERDASSAADAATAWRLATPVRKHIGSRSESARMFR